MKKTYLLIVLFLCGLSVGNLCASASAAAATKAEGELDIELRGLIQDAAEAGDSQEVARLLALASEAAEGGLGEELRKAGIGKEEEDVRNLFASASAAAAAEEAAAVVLGQELIEAAIKGDEKKVKELIAAGANVNARYYLGNTALIFAAQGAHENIVDLLLEKRGIEVNAQDVVGWTALMRAAFNGHTDIVIKLLDAGADKDIQGIDGQTAADLTRNPEIARMIREYRPGGLTKSAGKFVLLTVKKAELMRS